MTLTSITPEPTEEEAAAIVAALHQAQPQMVIDQGAPQQRYGAWRFSGRWWSLPIPVRRNRPWH